MHESNGFKFDFANFFTDVMMMMKFFASLRTTISYQHKLYFIFFGYSREWFFLRHDNLRFLDFFLALLRGTLQYRYWNSGDPFNNKSVSILAQLLIIRDGENGEVWSR